MIIRIPFSEDLEAKTGVFFFYLNIQKKKRDINKIKKRSTKKSSSSIVNEIKNEIQKEMQKEIPKGAQNDFKKEFQKKIKSPIKDFDLRGSSIHRITNEKWRKIEKKIIRLEKEKFTKTLGFNDPAEFDKELTKIIRGTVMVQEQVRSRIRGVPSPAFKDQTSYTSTIKANGINLPLDFIKNQEILEGQEIELIPGKGEYLFYIKRKKQD